MGTGTPEAPITMAPKQVMGTTTTKMVPQRLTSKAFLADRKTKEIKKHFENQKVLKIKKKISKYYFFYLIKSYIFKG